MKNLLQQFNSILTEGISQEDLAHLLYDRLERRYPDIVTRYGHEVVGDTVDDVASFHAGAEELGSSDINIMIRQILKKLEQYNQDIDETKGLPYPGTYEQENNMFKTSGPKHIVAMTNEEHCPHCGGELVSEELMNEKKDACYYKVKSRYKVWPSAYASGALVKCRKKGASNWGTGGKSNESVDEGAMKDLHIDLQDQQWDAVVGYVINGLKKNMDIGRIELNLYKYAGQEMFDVDQELQDRGFSDIADLADHIRQHNGRYVPPTDFDLGKGVAEGQLDEKWSKKYKDSINCSNPKGFSQKAHCAGKEKNESSILKGLEQVDENLHQWFKEKWVRFGPDGKIRGDCARGSDSEGKPKCLPQAKAHSLGKKGRKYAAAKKRREDPNPERRGPAKNVATKKKSNEAINPAQQAAIAIAKKKQKELDEACWKGYHKEGNKKMFGKTYPNCVKNKK